MASFTLTLLDTVDVQGYIFGSNRLRENLGASQLVYALTEEWLRESLQQVVGGSHNLKGDATINGSRILTPENALQAEVVFAGGGNALLLFRDHDAALALVRRLSEKLIADAPGLELAVAHRQFDWHAKQLGGSDGVYGQLQADLARAKQQRRAGGPLLGQSVTLECSSTGLPAVDYFPFGPDDVLPLSADAFAKAKEETWKAATKRLRDMLREPKDIVKGYEFSDDLDNLVSGAGDKSYVAVVHADGNGIGKRFKKLVDDTRDSRTCLNKLRELSQAVSAAGEQALRTTVETLVAALNPPHGGREEIEDFYQGLLKEKVKGRPKEKVRYLPFRPIVFGGDDLTFVCDGRLGLPLAAIYLEAWEQASRALPEGGQAYAAAGVAVVKTHYPFVRAYQLSEDLCTRAKRALKEVGKEQQGSALDWHFALSGIFGGIEAIREREYTTQHGSLTTRPIALAPSLFEPSYRTWKYVQYLVGVFLGEPVNKQGRFNKDGKPYYRGTNTVKGLREALRAGPNEVGMFLLVRALHPLPTIDVSLDALQRTGWASDHTPYFDPIEALDFFLPLEPWENIS